MCDVDHNETAEDCRSVAPAGTDDALLQACEGFTQAFDNWRHLIQHGNDAALPSKDTTHQDVLETRQRWRQALADVRALPARGRDGLKAKRGVFGTLSYFSEAGDPSFVEFAVELIDEYHNFVVDKSASTSGATEHDSVADNASCGARLKTACRWNLPNLFGIFNIKHRHSHFRSGCSSSP